MIDEHKSHDFATAFTVPLQQMNDWQLLQYNGIAPNHTSFTQAGMTVEVMCSASPIIYPLDAARLALQRSQPPGARRLH